MSRNYLTALVIFKAEMWRGWGESSITPASFPASHPPASPKDQTFCKLNPKRITPLRSGKTKINEYREVLSKSNQDSSNPSDTTRKHRWFLRFTASRPSSSGRLGTCHYPWHRVRDWGSTQGSSLHLQGYFALSAGIYLHPRSSRFPSP